MHSRRPPTPPAPAFRIAEPHAPGTPPDESAAEPRPPAPPPRGREAEPPAPAARPARDPRDEAAPPWHRSEAWAAVMLASFAVMLGAIVVPGLFKLVLIGLSALLGVVGVVMLARRGVFDHPSSHDG